MLKEILHVGLTVKDIDKSIDFYNNVLGLSFQGEMIMEGIETDILFGIKDCKVRVAYLNGGRELSSPPIELLQFETDDVQTDYVCLKKTSISEVCFKVDDIDKTYSILKDNGVSFISSPQVFDFTSQGFGKSKAVYFRDPDGIILELIEIIE